MSAAQAIGTPAVSPEPAIADEPISLSDAISNYEAPADDEPAEEGVAEPAAPAVASPGEDLFSEKALAAPGGVAKAQAALKASQQKHDREYLKLQERTRSFNQRQEQQKTEVSQARAYVQAINADVQLLANGTADQKLDALGRLTRRDGLKVWEELAIGAAGGKKPAPSQEALELRQMMLEMRQEREQERAQAVEHSQLGQLQQLKGQMLQGASDSTQFPALAHFAASKPSEVVEELHDRILNAHNAGRPITWAAAYQQLNAELAQYHHPAAPVAAVVPQGTGDLAISAAQAAKPVAQAQRSPGRSLNPSLATRQGGSVREMTEQERIAELASDPDFMSSLF